MNSFFYLQAEKNTRNSDFFDSLEAFSAKNCIQIYAINRPLSDSRYSYAYTDCVVVLIPNYKIIFIDFGCNRERFEDFCEDFLEDLGSLSDKYRYKETIGRPRKWRDSLICQITYETSCNDIDHLLTQNKITQSEDKRTCELLISLLTGSINDIDRVKDNIPTTLLDKIKQKIILLDGDQSRFIYHKPTKKRVTIQGLSGTGKTELLLHKLKELYTENSKNKIFLTCHNKILADSLKKRIPQFFNFMKVEEQIQWESRLWCANAWGSRLKRNSGLYSYLCDYYNVTFHQYDIFTSFDYACNKALEEIKRIADPPVQPFDYLLIDESQDFPNSFFDLCEHVCSKTIYIAGDIFQSIFDTNIIGEIAPDYLLSKCYRTDPKTLMFAHALGMGLFETPKLRWLKDSEWNACGYIVDKRQDVGVEKYYLSREPLRRFEDLEVEDFKSAEIVSVSQDEPASIDQIVVNIIHAIKRENATVQPKDIGVIFIDGTKEAYYTADCIEMNISRTFGWPVNKAYESKSSDNDSLFISNKNNVKGLEFPFVICIAGHVSDSRNYRNSLYMMITRSFIKTYLVLPAISNQHLIANIQAGLNHILNYGSISAYPPSDAEKNAFGTTINYTDNSSSIYDITTDVFKDMHVDEEFYEKLRSVVVTAVPDTFNYDIIREIVEANYRIMSR